MKRNFLLFGALAASLLLSAGCEKENTEPTPTPAPEDNWTFDGDEATVLEFTKAEAQYIGDDTYSEISDHWIVELTNEKGDTLALELNAKFNSAQTCDFSFLYGSYGAPQNNGDFSEGTYCYGEAHSIDGPGTIVYIPLGTYYQFKNEEGNTSVDYLFMGTVTLSEDGIQGTLVGESFQKRTFTYTGSTVEVPVRFRGYSNTNLTSDVTLNDLGVMRIRDRGNFFWLTDENNNDVTTYRYIELLLSDGNVTRNINSSTAKYVMAGTGNFLKLGLLVNYDATVSTIPAGEYTMAPANEYGGIDRDEIVPFRFQAGVDDSFGKQNGSWYVGLTDGVWSQYARIAGGTITVSVKDDGTRVLSFELLDCASDPKKISGSIEL